MSEAKHTPGLEKRVETINAANSIGGSEVYDPYAALSCLIASRLLGVKPDEQDLELDDHDWRLIIDALSHKALNRAEMNGDQAQDTASSKVLGALKVALPHLEDNARFLRDMQAHSGKVVDAFSAVVIVRSAITKAEAGL